MDTQLAVALSFVAGVGFALGFVGLVLGWRGRPTLPAPPFTEEASRWRPWLPAWNRPKEAKRSYAVMAALNQTRAAQIVAERELACLMLDTIQNDQLGWDDIAAAIASDVDQAHALLLDLCSRHPDLRPVA